MHSSLIERDPFPNRKYEKIVLVLKENSHSKKSVIYQ